jgi:hypothetical protein
MVEQAVADARELLTKDSVRQSRVDYAATRILDRMQMLVPSGYIAPEESGSESSSDQSYEKGCKSAIAGASAFTIAALIGTAAFVVKKKED